MTDFFKLLLLFSLIALIQGKLHRLQIHRDKYALKTIGSVLGLKQFIAKKHNIDMGETAPCAEDVDTYNATFYGYIFIGSPPQQVRVNFDTAHSGLIVTSKQFEVEKSKTATYFFTNYYLEDPFIYGIDYQHTDSIYIDYVSVAGLIFDQNIPVFDSSIGEYGIFGLAVNGTQNYVHSPLKTMYSKQLIGAEIFSMYLLEEGTTKTPEYAGELLFGGSDPTAYNGSLNYINLIGLDSLSFAFNMDQVSIAGRTVDSKVAAIIDSGSQFISAPILPYALINAKLGGLTDENGNYFVNCSTVDTLPNVDITIAGKTISLTSSVYILKITAENGDLLCMSAFSYTSTKYWVLGTPFMVNNYFEFDVTNKRIGWAPAATYNGPLTINFPTPSKLPLPKKIC